MGVCGSADALEVTLLAEAVVHGDRVGRLVLAVQGEQDAPDRLVGGPVEGAVAEHRPHLVDRLATVHAGAEYRQLGVDVVRRLHGRVHRRRAGCPGGG